MPVLTPLGKIAMPVAGGDSTHPALVLQSQNINIANAGIRVIRNENKPEFSGRFSANVCGELVIHSVDFLFQRLSLC